MPRCQPDTRMNLSLSLSPLFLTPPSLPSLTYTQLKLGRHVYSCLYGTFLYNSMREREAGRVTEDTTSVWALLHEGNTDLINYLYSRDSIENKVS